MHRPCRDLQKPEISMYVSLSLLSQVTVCFPKKRWVGSGVGSYQENTKFFEEKVYHTSFGQYIGVAFFFRLDSG